MAAERSRDVATQPSQADAELVPLERVRTRMASLWLIGGLLILFVLVFQSLMGRYGGKVAEVWGWLLPTLMPTLTMILTVLGYSALSAALSGVIVRRDFFTIAFWLSAFYLTLVALTILIQPWAATTPDEALALMQMSNLWLGPMQGLVSAVLGVLFVTRQKPSATTA